MAQKSSQPIGITLPITRGDTGYFAQSFSVIEQIKSNLHLLLRTRKGERRMNPEFGSGLWNILFESYTDDITPIIESTIKKDINLWMPFVAVQKVSAVTSSTQYGRIDVTVLFTAPSAGVMATQELTMGVANNTL